MDALTIALIVLGIIILVALVAVFARRKQGEHLEHRREDAREHRSMAAISRLEADRQAADAMARRAEADARMARARSDELAAKKDHLAATADHQEALGHRREADELRTKADELDPDIEDERHGPDRPQHLGRDQREQRDEIDLTEHERRARAERTDGEGVDETGTAGGPMQPHRSRH